MNVLARQVAIAAAGRAFASRDVKNAEATIADGKSKKIKATIAIDGVLSRGHGTDQAASAGPLQDALLVVLAQGLSPAQRNAKIRAALKIAKAVGGKKVIDHVAAGDAEFAALIAEVKAQASKHFDSTPKRGSLKFSGSAEVVKAKANAA